jgi:hypothetical protein
VAEGFAVDEPRRPPTTAAPHTPAARSGRPPTAVLEGERGEPSSARGSAPVVLGAASRRPSVRHIPSPVRQEVTRARQASVRSLHGEERAMVGGREGSV